MAIGGAINEEQTVEILTYLKSRNVRELDTALMYMNGETEKVLGNVVEKNADLRCFDIATKSNPWFGNVKSAKSAMMQGGLRPDLLEQQIKLSLASLRTKAVDILYLHAPDHENPLADSLAVVDKYAKQGAFREFGLSNYSAELVREVHAICEKNDYIRPTLYQGMYNAITRRVETELLPTLRELNIRFYAYNPLAGGLLTGRYSLGADPSEGRFSGNSSWGKVYRERFMQKEQFEAMELVRTACEAAGIHMAEASLRWLMHHGQLDGGKGDGVILGGSSLAHVQQNVDAVHGAALPAEIVDAFASAWKCCHNVCPDYAR
eukprot:CAMPEP_0119131712 /NCGR_PEP_ID=MMETSP1310-20130426/10534_1 /TAXON_ID=464262 /ORGANISM="Genus nov. species nov., Strain RCC2339" /LENGTH=319 /DNA_ID=CAMNT_0007122303 /DNA_START=82 /DNA_END=1041 /DNA_ORIENTATION=+